MSPRKSVFVTAVILGAMAAAPGASAQTTLLFNLFVPPNHPIRIIAQDWAKEVAKATDGRIAVRFPAKTLAPPPRQWGMITKGIADVTIMFNAFERNRLQLPPVGELPLWTTTAQASSLALWRTYEKYFAAANEYKGVKMLGLFLHAGGDIQSLRKPIRTVADLGQVKIRVSPGVAAKALSALGAVVVPTPGVKAYQVVSKGIVDGLIFPNSDLAKFKMVQYTKYSTRIPGKIYNASFSVFMNQKKWDGLSPADQAAIIGASGEAIGRSAKAWDDGERIGLAAMTKAGVNRFTASDAFMAELRSKLAFMDAEWLENAAGRGVDGKAAMAFYRSEAKKLAR